MSPKKKPTPPKSAPKDDLIDALYESESVGRAARKNLQDTGTQSENTNRLSEARRGASGEGQRPPPPPPANDNDRIYNFDSDPTRSIAPDDPDVYDAAKEDMPTLSIVRREGGEHPHSTPMFEESSTPINLELEEQKTIVHNASHEGSQTGSKAGASRLSQHGQTKSQPHVAGSSEASGPTSKPGDKLQKLEDVLRRLKPQVSGKPKTPLYDSDTAVAAVDAAKVHGNQIDALAPPPVKPVGVVAKAIYSGTNPMAEQERAPTEPVRSSADSNEDEKTVAANPSPEMMKPVWQDAKTELLSKMTSSDNPDNDPEAEQFMPTEIRPNSPGARFREEARKAQPGAAIFSSAEAALRQSENLRVAQKRISDLENELERVRRENESLRSAGETLRRRMDELQAHAETAELNTQEAKKIAEEERKVLKGQIQSRDREISEMKSRIDDAENRLESNFRKIRVRERDLEHRIEIIKAESQSIAASKDRMILELKRQIDQISSELNHSKAQLQETFGQFKEKQETARRAVRALRIALTVLEGEEDPGSRKA